MRFLADVKAGDPEVHAPVYSHQRYDIVPGAAQTVRQPDIVIVEGLNVLQAPPASATPNQLFASDFFDFSIYVDADERDIEQWYVARFLRLGDTVFQDPESYFHRYASLDEDEARATAANIWARDQRAQPAREHPADAHARAPDPHQGRRPPRRARAAAPRLTPHRRIIEDRHGASDSGAEGGAAAPWHDSVGGVAGLLSRTVAPEIAELREAVSGNAAHTKELAEQLERTVTALEETARVAESRLRLTLWMAGGALALAAIALVLGIVAFRS